MRLARQLKPEHEREERNDKHQKRIGTPGGREIAVHKRMGRCLRAASGTFETGKVMKQTAREPAGDSRIKIVIDNRYSRSKQQKPCD